MPAEIKYNICQSKRIIEYIRGNGSYGFLWKTDNGHYLEELTFQVVSMLFPGRDDHFPSEIYSNTSYFTGLVKAILSM